VPKGRAVVMPFSEQTRGHGSHTIAPIWKHLLAELLAASSRQPR
jgi:homoserine O-acetyltransferase